MSIDLLTARCWPVRLRDGSRRFISMSDIGNPDILAFDATRADFNGALVQFGIALLQTVAAVDGPATWRDRLRNPSDPQTLQDWFSPLAGAFQLDGDGARFMQDFTLRETDCEPTPIAALLIETPGDNTVRNNADLFIKRRRIERLCPTCAAMALLTLQFNAPAGGAGHRTSLRGGGPLTTLLVPGAAGTLWQSLWLNVLPASQFDQLNGESNHARPEHRMPWLASVEQLQSRKDGEVQPAQVHPQHVYWGTPRRIRLDFVNTVAGACDLCGARGDRLLTQYITRNYGLNYKGPWRHPLSPCYELNGQWPHVHPQPGGLGYRHWLGLTLGIDGAKGSKAPAPVVQHFLSDQERRLATSDLPLRLWCFGYDMDNMKARCWYEGTMPLYDLTGCSAADQAALRDDVRDWIAGAESVGSMMRMAVRDAFFGRDAKGDFSHVDATFWSVTEERFQELLRDTVASYRAGTRGDGFARREAWLRYLQTTALRLFESDFIGAGPLGQHNMRRIAEAHASLRRNLHGPKLRSALGLPVSLGSIRSKKPSRKTAHRARSTAPAGAMP